MMSVPETFKKGREAKLRELIRELRWKWRKGSKTKTPKVEVRP